MFCPVCRYEYLEGVTECNDCRVPLVEVLPPEEPKEETPLPPLLKFAAPSAIIGLSYVFVVRTLNTIFPGMFLNFKLAQWNSVFNLLAQLMLLFFFVCFYYEYVQEEQKKLKTAAILVIAAELVTTLLRVTGVMGVVSRASILPQTHVIFISMMILSWVIAAVFLYFFVVLYKEISSRPSKRFLEKAVFWAAAGAAVLLLRQTLTVLFYYFQSATGNAIDFTGREIYPILLSIPLVIFPVVTMLIFFIAIYREQKT